MKAVLRHLVALLGPGEEGDRHRFELLLVLVLIIVIAAVSLVFLGDAVADLISLIGGYVDERTLSE